LLLPNWLPGRGLGRFWIFFFRPRCKGRANDVGSFRRQLSRVYGADRPRFLPIF
jgi:hypothetical protein